MVFENKIKIKIIYFFKYKWFTYCIQSTNQSIAWSKNYENPILSWEKMNKTDQLTFSNNLFIHSLDFWEKTLRVLLFENFQKQQKLCGKKTIEFFF